MKSNPWRRRVAQPCLSSPKDEVKRLQFGVINSGSCCCQEPECLFLDLQSQWPKLLICSSGTGWCVDFVCGGCVFSALVLSHHMMVNFCQWDTPFSLPKLAFPANHYICPVRSFTLPICQPCGTCQREQILHEKLLCNLWTRAETADLTTQWQLPGNFWMILQKCKTES